MENIRRYFKRTDKTYLLLCIFSSVMAVTALSSWAAKQGNGFAVDEITGQITGLGDYRRAAVQAGAALIGLVIAVLLSNIDYRSLVKEWPVHVAHLGHGAAHAGAAQCEHRPADHRLQRG